MGFKRTTGWWISRREAAVLAAIVGYAAAVVVISPLLLGLLPLLAVVGMLRVPVESLLEAAPTPITELVGQGWYSGPAAGAGASTETSRIPSRKRATD